MHFIRNVSITKTFGRLHILKSNKIKCKIRNLATKKEVLSEINIFKTHKSAIKFASLADRLSE